LGKKTAVIIGAGPAGLTAAFELLKRTDYIPVVLESTDRIGGISCTVNYRGNRIDIGGHRFYSRSDRVNQWWLSLFPLQGAPSCDDRLTGRNPVTPGGPDPQTSELVMLRRSRLSRIFFEKNFFDYPLSLSPDTILRLGLLRTFRIGASYLKARALPVVPERSLEDFFINRFGRELYSTFFRDYTEKVWGISCTGISPEWGAQRVRGLSIQSAIRHAARQLLGRNNKPVETTLINEFMYPKRGPGQLWEEVARQVVGMGGEVRTGCTVDNFTFENGKLHEVVCSSKGEPFRIASDLVISSMPVKDLVGSLGSCVPAEISTIAQGLVYRDFIMLGLLVKEMNTGVPSPAFSNIRIVPDNWIYIQEPKVTMGRLQVYNNWSPYMVADSSSVWLGLEYFCNENDALWTRRDADVAELAIGELALMGLIDPAAVRDWTVVRMPKAYPAYFGTYQRFGEVRAWLDTIPNLYCIGRNGMHKYNNMDHSMLTAMTVVDQIASGTGGRDAVWAVNTEETYGEH
jgi:protoporphyrinogen oxidase